MLWLALLFPLTAAGQESPGPERITAGQPLAEALRVLQEQGLLLDVAADIVTPQMQVHAEPVSRTPRAVLDELLAPHGLVAQETAEGRVVVRSRLGETVDVQARADAGTDLSPTLEMRPLDVMAVAGAAENVFRTIQMFPGVAGVNEIEGRVAVRGGGPDQNLTVMDGVEMHNPYRLFGVASAFNPETVERFELVTGAFHPRYGDRLSSILVVETRPGTREKAFTGSSSVSLTDANVVLEGRLPGPGDGAWLLTGRRTYYDLLLESLAEDADLPSFTDQQLKTEWNLGGGRRLSVLALRNREGSLVDRGDPDEYRTTARSGVLSARFRAPVSARAVSQTVASWYSNDDVMGFLDESRTITDDDPLGLDIAELVVARDVRVRDLALRQELDYQASPRHRLGAGFDAHSLSADVGWRLRAHGGTEVVPHQSTFPRHFRGGLWIHDRFLASKRVTVEAGLRLDRGGLSTSTTLSPRLSARVRLDAATTLGLAAGVHRQSTGFEKFLQRDILINGASLFELDRQPAGGLRSERARHVVATLDRRLHHGLELRAEAYFKRFDNLVIGRLETEDERQGRVARHDFAEALRAHIPEAPLVTRAPVNDGRGRAYGLELLLTRRTPAPAGRVGGWAAYSFGVADREAYGVRHPFDYDRRHALSLVASYRPSPSLELAAAGRLASGFPWTEPVGVRVNAVPDTRDRDEDGDRTELVPDQRGSNRPGSYRYRIDFGGVENRNRGRGPAYSRVDLRASFHPRFWGGRWTLYVDVINVLGRRNWVVPSWSWEGNPLQGPVRIHRDREVGSGLPRLPSIGIRVRF